MNIIRQTQLCEEDNDCPEGQYCYEISKHCVNFTKCSRYNRQEAEKLSRDPYHCGPCIKGYTAEILGTGDTAELCNKIDTSLDDPVSAIDTGVFGFAWMWIFYITLGVLISCSIVIASIICFKKHCFRKRNIIRSEWSDIETATASAPPEEHSPFIEFRKGTYALPYNNNKNVVDSDRFVTAVPFNAPRWISNTNFNSNHSDNDEADASNEMGIVSHISATDDNHSANNSHSGQLSVELPEQTTEYHDNARNTALMQNYPLPSNHDTNDHESTSEPNDNKRNRDGARTSNVLISQNITMNVNLINGDEC